MTIVFMKCLVGQMVITNSKDQLKNEENNRVNYISDYNSVTIVYTSCEIATFVETRWCPLVRTYSSLFLCKALYIEQSNSRQHIPHKPNLFQFGSFLKIGDSQNCQTW